MKKLSCILLAVMLITAMFVSCKAEVIDDSNLVDVRFTTDDNAKGLNWSRPAFDSNDYVWYYTAVKKDDGPKTGQSQINGDKITKEIVGKDGKLTEQVGPFSQGEWKFSLYGYAKDERGIKTDVLVYSGSAECTLTREDSTVGIQVQALVSETGKGIILVSKDVSLVVNRKSFAPTSVKVETKDGESIENCQEQVFDANNGNSFILTSGFYKVTIARIVEGITYASNSIYVTVYDGQTTTINGTLDEITTSTKFEAEDGSICGGVEGDLDATTHTTLTIDDFPAPGAKTSVKIPQIYGNKKAVLNVVAYPSSLVAKTFGFDANESVPFAGMDFTLTVDGTKEDFFGIGDARLVEVTTYINKGLDGSKLKLIYNGPETKNGYSLEHKIKSYDSMTGELVFVTNHFSQFFVASDEVVALSATGNGAYTSLQDAINDAKNGDTISIVKNTNVSDTVVVDSKQITLNLNGNKIYNAEDLWDNAESVKNWSLVSVRGTDGDLTITGNGSLKAKKDDCYAVDVKDGAKLTIENGTFIGNISAVYVYEGTANINGGKYTIQQLNGNKVQDEYGLLLNCYDTNRANGTAKIVVTGGTFEKFNPAANGAESGGLDGNPTGTNFLAEGYEVVEDGDFYTVVRSKVVKSLADLKDAASEGGSWKLADDLNITEEISVTSDFSLDLKDHTISSQKDNLRLFNVKEGNFGLSNGKLEIKNYQCTGIYISLKGEAVIKDVIINLKDEKCTGVYMNGELEASFEQVEINSGRENNKGICLTASSSAKFVNCQFNGSGTFYVYNSKIEITGGCISGGSFNISGDSSEYIFNEGFIVKEGTTTSFYPSDCLADGCRATKNANGTWTVSKASTPNPDPEQGDEP